MPFADEMFVCSCGEKLRNKDDVSRHDKRWSELGHDMQCQHPGCGKTSPQTSNAKRHWRCHLPKSLSNYFCQKCCNGYAKPEHLKKHEAALICRFNRKGCPSRIELMNEEAAQLQQLRSMDLSRPPSNSAAPSPSTEAAHSRQHDSGPLFSSCTQDSTWANSTSITAFEYMVNSFNIADLPL